MKPIRRYGLQGLLGSLLIALALAACADRSEPPVPIYLTPLVYGGAPDPYYNGENWRIDYESIWLLPYDVYCTTADNQTFEMYGTADMEIALGGSGALLGYFDAEARACTTLTFGIPEPEIEDAEHPEEAFIITAGQAKSAEGTIETFRFELAGFTDRAIGTKVIDDEKVAETDSLPRIEIGMEIINWLTFVDFSELPTNPSGQRIMPPGSPYAHAWRSSLLNLGEYEVHWSY